MSINPLYLNISILILHTVLLTFPLLLTRRIHLTIKAYEVGDYFLYSQDVNK